MGGLSWKLKGLSLALRGLSGLERLGWVGGTLGKAKNDQKLFSNFPIFLLHSVKLMSYWYEKHIFNPNWLSFAVF